MTANDLRIKLLRAETLPDSNKLPHLRTSLRDYGISNCLKPRKLLVSMSYNGRPETILVPCGRCYHCRQTRINEWVTRCYAHADTYKYVYFVTLSYTSCKSNSPLSQFLMRELSECYWHYDNLNYYGTYSYNPTLLCRKHYQYFLKRLRKRCNCELSYIISGEYGHRFGRPHYHLVLFSDLPLTIDDIKYAWSLNVVQDSNGVYHRSTSRGHRLLFGNIDFNDLVQNGSFNQSKKVSVDGKTLSARNCFAYVCKYLYKTDYSDSRVKLAYNDLYRVSERTNWRGTYTAVYNPNFNLFIPKIHEKTSLTTTCHEFVGLFAPFVSVSRGRAIGSLYAKNHMAEFVQGHFSRPPLQIKGYVLPSYFVRKMEEFLLPLRRIKRTASAVSFIKGNLPLLSSDFKGICENRLARPYLLAVERFNWDSPQDLLRSDYAFVDLLTRERYLMCYDSFGSLYVRAYKYDRSKRCYVHSRIIDIETFVRSFFNSFREYADYCASHVPKREERLRALEFCRNYIDSFYSWYDLVNYVYDALQNDVKQQNLIYNLTHNNLE